MLLNLSWVCLLSGFLFPTLWGPRSLEAADYPHTKLSGVMAAGGTAIQMKLSPDGNYLVFRADKVTQGIIELFSVNLGTREVIKLNGDLPAGGDIFGFEISPTGTRVVYQTVNSSNGRALYSVLIGGGAIRNISHIPSSPDKRSENFEITPDGNTVVFRSNFSGRFELYRSPITGVTVSEPPFRLNSNMVPNGEVQWARLSPDGSRVVYKAEAVALNQVDLFTVPITGVGDLQITNLGPDWDINQFWITPDSSRIVYTTFGGGRNQLFSVPLAGGTVTRLDNPSIADYYIGNVLLSADSGWVVYTGRQQSTKYELFSVPVSGPQASSRKLNPDLPAFADLNGPGDSGFVEVSPDSAQVIYNADLEVDGKFNLYRVSIAGPAGHQVQVNPPLTQGNGVTGGRYLCSGNWLLYWLESGVSSLSESFLIPGSLDQPARSLTEPFVPLGQYLETFVTSPDCRWLMMRIHTGPLAENQGYKVWLSGGMPTRFHPDFQDPPGGISQMMISPDGQTLYYLADAEVNHRSEIYQTGLYTLYLPVLLK